MEFICEVILCEDSRMFETAKKFNGYIVIIVVMNFRK